MLVLPATAALAAVLLQLSPPAGAPALPGAPALGADALRDDAHAWSATFQERGARLAPDTGGWSLALRLAAVGFDGDQRPFDRPLASRLDGGRFAYAWSDSVEEWYVQRPAGIEHGFTLLERPLRSTCAEARLAVDLAVEGDLSARIAAGGRDVAFHFGPIAAFDYTGLTVFDADGRVLPARFEPLAGGLRISIDERDARYPIVIDPLLQRAYIKAINPEPDDRFGVAVAVSGDLLAAGAMDEDSAATGVGGNAASNGAPDSGAVYLYRRTGNSWAFEAYVKASNTGVTDRFGFSVALDGDLLVVGAPGERSAATGVGGNQLDDSAPGAGAVYVFRRSGSVWSQEAYLKASNTGAGDAFGNAVEVDGDRIVVGAKGEDSATGVDPFDDSALDAGAVYVFEFDAGAWLPPAYLKANEPDRDDLFGEDVAIEGDTILVGAPREDGGSNMIGGDETDDSALDAGAAYVFDGSSGTWSQAEYLKPFNAAQGDYFGDAVALSGGLALVGAPFEDSGIPGVNGNGMDNSQFSSGAAYTFRRPLASWVQEAYLKSSNPGSFDRFGSALDLDGGFLVVGAHGERSGATGINGSQSSNTAGSSGAAYLYTRATIPWIQVAFVKASNTQSLDQFGGAVALSGDRLVIGASREDSASAGVGGSQSSNGATDSGAVYAFEVFGSAISSFCFAQPNSTGVGASIGGLGSASVSANDLVLSVTSLPGNSFGYFLVSQVRGFVSMPAGSSGDLCIGGSIGRYVGPGEIQNSGMGGSFSLPIDTLSIPQPNGFVSATAGSAWHFQAWYRDAIGGVPTSNFSDGLTVLFEQ